MMQTTVPIVRAYPVDRDNNIPVTDAIPLNYPNGFISKNNFIKNTFTVLLFQLSLTFSGCVIAIYNKPILINYLNENSSMLFVPFVLMPFALIFTNASISTF